MASDKNGPPQDSRPPSRSDADRRIRQAGRLADHLRLLQLLLGRGRWDVRSLAAELECTDRTIYRCLKVLEFAGIPCVYDKDQRCYRVRPDVKFPVLHLSRDELLGQATAAAVTKASGIDAAAGATAATRKMAAVSRNDVSELLADAEAITSVLDLKLADHSKHQDMIKTVQWALIEGKQLTGSYKSPYLDKSVLLTLHPYRLCLSGQAWYLIGTTADSEQPKTYRITRFESIRMLDESAEVPERFDLGDYFGNAWNVFRGDKTYDVEVEFTKEAADLVTETSWHKTQEIKRHHDGRVTLKFRVDGLDEILWWVLGWSGRAKVKKPKELKALVVEKLTKALNMHVPAGQ